ncbi:MAG TPA: hypothetical protein VKL22_02830 [Actinomycetota bacterium]|nr:hypothetical protein [Actinomycetota bacterium]
MPAGPAHYRSAGGTSTGNAGNQERTGEAPMMEIHTLLKKDEGGVPIIAAIPVPLAGAANFVPNAFWASHVLPTRTPVTVSAHGREE